MAMSKQDVLIFPKALVPLHLCKPELRTYSWLSGKNTCGSKRRGGEGGGAKKIMVVKKNEKKKKDEEEGRGT
jgi:hypothetical protein